MRGSRFQTLTDEAFAPFGRVLRSESPGFTSLFEQPDAEGWLVGLNRVTYSGIRTMHFHPDTWECFFPTDGDTALAVAPRSIAGLEIAGVAREAVIVFRLTVPVCVSPGTWHSLVRTGRGTAESGGIVYVCENARVTGTEVVLAEEIFCDRSNE